MFKCFINSTSLVETCTAYSQYLKSVVKQEILKYIRSWFYQIQFRVNDSYIYIMIYISFIMLLTVFECTVIIRSF